MTEAAAGLSARQQRLLEAIRRFNAEYGYPPSVRDLLRLTGTSSTSVVHYNLKVLGAKGYIRHDEDVSRGIHVLEDDSRTRVRRVAIEGRIAAGQPLEVVAAPAETIDLPSDIAPSGVYALRVKGKSMIEDMIDNGDLVLVRRQETAQDGDIVVALLMDTPTGEWQATLKRLYREKDSIRLQPANAELAPIFVAPPDLRIQGKVVAVIRQFH